MYIYIYDLPTGSGCTLYFVILCHCNLYNVKYISILYCNTFAHAIDIVTIFICRPEPES